MQFQDAIIHAYEPNIDLKPYLEHQANFANAEVFFEAIGMAEGKVSLDFGEDSVHTKAIMESGGKIQQIAFKKAIERLGGSVDLVKIDCEGGEWDILKDCKSWVKVDRLVMEYHLFHEHKSHSEIRSALKKINFDIKIIKELKTCGMLYAERYGLSK
jgi:FkbM family methyltransferase